MKAVNLIPSEERRGGSVGIGRSGGAAYIVLGALGVLAVLVLLYGMARHQVSDRKDKARFDHGADPARAGSCQRAHSLHELRRAARTAHGGGRGGCRLAL